jgi:ankyrin repeat protein
VFNTQDYEEGNMRNNLKVKEQQIANDENITDFKQANQEYKKTKTKSKQDNETYDSLYGNTNSLKSKSQNKPPKNSLSDLVYSNKLAELEKRLNCETVNIDCRDEEGITASWTPLYWSVKFRKIECAKLLLTYGADINMVVNDLEECCGTVLDLATLRCDDEMEAILREFAEKDDINLGVTFKAIRTKLRGKAPAFHFNGFGKKKSEE